MCCKYDYICYCKVYAKAFLLLIHLYINLWQMFSGLPYCQ